MLCKTTKKTIIKIKAKTPADLNVSSGLTNPTKFATISVPAIKTNAFKAAVIPNSPPLKPEGSIFWAHVSSSVITTAETSPVRNTQIQEIIAFVQSSVPMQSIAKKIAEPVNIFLALKNYDSKSTNSAPKLNPRPRNVRSTVKSSTPSP